jgi:hypothetical protein
MEPGTIRFFALLLVVEIERVRFVHIERGGFAEVVETGPDIFASNKGVLFEQLEIQVRAVRPARCVEFVGTHLVSAESRSLVPFHGEKVAAAAAHAG